MFQTIQILCTLFMLITVYRSYKKEKKSLQCAMVCFCFLAAIGSNAVLQQIPMPKEEITIRALGEKNEEAKADEILFKGFLLEGEEYNKIDILEGKWFWSGENYMWRNEKDTRQPEGITREITLAIPMGTHREAVFNVSQWNGKAEIQYGEHIQVVDFGPGNETNVELEDSNLLSLRMVKLTRLLGYLFSVSFLIWVLHKGRKEYLKDTLKYHTLYEEKKFYFFLACICFIQFLFFWKYAGIDGFWVDEMTIIGFSIGDGSLFGELFLLTPPMPFVVLLERIIYYAMPYGEKWLLLPYMLATLIGMYYTGLSSKILIGEKGGKLSVLFMLFSQLIIVQLAYEVRSYAFYFMGSALTLYFYFRRLEHLGCETKKDMIRLTFSMIFFSQMHYYAVVICILYGCLDLFLYVKKKIKLVCITPYLCSALLYLPTVVFILKDLFKGNSSVITQNNWQQTPSLERVIYLLKYLLGDNSYLTFLMIFGVVSVCGILFDNRNNNLFHFIRHIVLCLIPCGLISLMFLYGRVINPNATLWNQRYFAGIIPFLYIFVSFGLIGITEMLKTNRKSTYDVVPITFALLIIPSSYVISSKEATTVRQPWRESANYLYTQVNYIYNESTLVISTNANSDSGDHTTRGWNEYYLTRQGERDELNVITQSDISKIDLDSVNRIYIMYIHSGFSNTNRAIVEEDFELIDDNTSLKVMTYVRKTNETGG